MSLHNIRIKFKAFNSGLLDKSVVQIVNSVKEFGGTVVGPIPLPRRFEKFTVTRSPHVDKKSMEQFIKTKHTRMICIVGASPSIIDELSKMEIPAGIGIEINITS